MPAVAQNPVLPEAAGRSDPSLSLLAWRPCLPSPSLRPLVAVPPGTCSVSPTIVKGFGLRLTPGQDFLRRNPAVFNTNSSFLNSPTASGQMWIRVRWTLSPYFPSPRGWTRWKRARNALNLCLRRGGGAGERASREERGLGGGKRSEHQDKGKALAARGGKAKQEQRLQTGAREGRGWKDVVD